METRDLDYFAAVARHGGVRRAAEALELSQPALSKALRRLEHSVGTRLVQRTARGVELTEAGTAVLAHARRVRLVHEDVVRAAEDIGRGHAGHVRVGTGSAMAHLLLPSACAVLAREAPQVTVNISVSANDLLVPALRNGELDLVVSGIPASPHEGLIHERLYDDEFVVYASARHRLASKARVVLADLVAERWATSGDHTLSWQWLHRAFTDRGLPAPRVAVNTSAIAIKFPLVGASDLLGFGPRSSVREAARRQGLVELRVKELGWRRRVGVSHRRDAYLSPAALKLIDILKTTAAQLSARTRARAAAAGG